MHSAFEARAGAKKSDSTHLGLKWLISGQITKIFTKKKNISKMDFLHQTYKSIIWPEMSQSFIFYIVNSSSYLPTCGKWAFLTNNWLFSFFFHSVCLIFFSKLHFLQTHCGYPFPQKRPTTYMIYKMSEQISSQVCSP